MCSKMYFAILDMNLLNTIGNISMDDSAVRSSSITILNAL